MLGRGSMPGRVRNEARVGAPPLAGNMPLQAQPTVAIDTVAFEALLAGACVLRAVAIEQVGAGRVGVAVVEPRCALVVVLCKRVGNRACDQWEML
jgi:hypothetical protein